MSKRSIILTITAVLILAIVLFFYFARNFLISTVFENIVNDESGKRISLDIKGVQFDIFDNNIDIDSLTFTFDTAYFDSTSSMFLKKMVFSGIQLRKLNVKRLLLDKIFEANSFLVSRPVLRFVTIEGNKKELTNPQDIIKFFIRSNSDNYGILVKLDTFSIKYGNVRVNKLNSNKKDLSISDMHIILKDFNTLVNDSVYVYGRMFFSKSLFISAKNIYKNIEPGANLYVDSVAWRSSDYHLSINGFRLIPDKNYPDSLPFARIAVDSVALDNFHLLNADSLSKIKAAKIYMTGGDIDIFIQNIATEKNINNNSKTPDLFKSIFVDTLEVNKVNLFLHNNDNDTLLYFRRLNLTVNELKFDSLFMQYPSKYFNYSKFKLNAESLVSKSLVKGYEIRNTYVNYQSNKEKLYLKDLTVKSNKGGLYSYVKQTNVKFSLIKLLKKNKQRINLTLVKPELKLNLKEYKFPVDSSEQKQNSYLIPESVSVIDGKANIITGNDDSISVKNLSLVTKNIIFKKDEKFAYDTLYFYGKDIKLVSKSGIKVTSSSIRFLNDNIDAANIAFLSPSGLRNFNSGQFRITNVDLNSLIINKNLIVDSVLLVNSNEVLETGHKGKDTASLKTDISSLVRDVESFSKLKIDVKHLGVLNNHFELLRKQGSLNNKFSFKSDLTWDNIKLGGLNDKPVSNLRNFDLKLYSINYYDSSFKIKFDSLKINSDHHLVTLNSIRLLNNDSVNGSQKFNFKNVSVKKVMLTGFNFDSLFISNKYYLDSVSISSPVFNFSSFSNSVQNNQFKNKFSKINITDSLPVNFSLNTFLVDNLHLNFEQKDSVSKTVYKLHDFSLIYDRPKQQDTVIITLGSVLDNVDFHFDSLYINKSENEFLLNVSKGNLSRNNNNLLLDNIYFNSGNINNKVKTQVIANGGKVKFEKVKVLNNLPVLFSIHNMDISDIDLKVFSGISNIAMSNDTLRKMAGIYNFSPFLDKLTIDSILFNNIDLKVYGKDTLKRKFTIDDLKVNLTDIKLSPSLALDTIPLTIKNINAVLYDRKLISGDSLYMIKAEKLNYNSFNKTLVIDSFYVVPRYDTLEFFTRNKWQTDRLNLFVDKISFAGFDVNKWDKKNLIHLSYIDAKGVVANLYRDKNFPLDTSFVRPLIQELLRKVDRPFRIDSVFVHESYLRYSELGEKSFQPGYVYFTDGSLKVYNITNRPVSGAGETMSANINMKLMGEGNIEGNFYFPLENQGEQFYFNATSGRLDLTLLNPMTKNLLGLAIKSGRGRINIPLITANDDFAKGYLLFKYRMKIQVYNRSRAEKNKEGGITSPFMNFILNGLVLKNRNPNIFNRPRVGIVYFERDKHKGIPNYIWKSTLSGILSTMGFNNKYQRKEKKVYRKSEFEEIRNSIKNTGNQKKRNPAKKEDTEK